MKKIFLLALSSVFCFAATPMLADDNNNVVNPDTEKYLSLDAIGNTETASLLELIPVRYVLRPAESIEIGTDTGKVVIGSPETVTREQFGLIAQDLKNIFPTLVYEIGNGEYGINYTGLIPVLIQSVKDLTAKVEVLQGYLGEVGAKVAAANYGLEELDEVLDTASKPSLASNMPSPAATDTKLQYYLPETVSEASIYIFDLNGAQKGVYNLTEKGNGTLTIKGGTFTAGMYLCSLVADGQLIDTKRMILTK